MSVFTIFISYAYKDKDLLDELIKHLNSLNRAGLISPWWDRNITAGNERIDEIDEHLRDADIILLLVSPDFVNSDHSYHGELKIAMERREKESATIIPVILRPVVWQGLLFDNLQVLPLNGMPITLWENIDTAFFEIVQGIKKVIEDLAARTAGSTPSPAKTSGSRSTPSVWHIPYKRNPFFTGRTTDLEQLYQLFAAHNDNITAIQVINGMGGIGKTQLALEYAYHYQEKYQTVFWLRSDTRADLISDFIEFANRLHLSERASTNQAQTITAVKRWLQTHSDWLLILDNLEDFSLLDEFVPTAARGHVLVTIRSTATGAIVQSLTLEKMAVHESIPLLLKRSKIVPLDSLPNNISEKDYAEARTIVEFLDGLPLALDQTGAYIEDTHMSLANYITIYQQRRAQLLNRRGKFALGHPASVTTTVMLAYERISNAAAELLLLFAHFHPDEIPEDLITRGASYVGPTLAPSVADLFELNELIEIILNYSLLHRSRETQTLSMHRLVQEILKDKLSEEERPVWALRAVNCVSVCFPLIERGNLATWLECRKYFPHAHQCVDLIKRYQLVNEESAHLLSRIGRYLYEQGQYREAETVFQLAAEMSEALMGAIHLTTAHSLKYLGEAYYMQGHYQQAATLYQRALEIYQQVQGEDSLDIAEIFDDLGVLYADMGLYEQATQFDGQALAIYEKLYGPDHPSTVQMCNNAGVDLMKCGKYDQAALLFQRALELRERVQGPEHQLTAESLNNMGFLLRKQQQYVRSEEMLKRAFAIRKKVLGPKHPYTAQTINNLGKLYDEIHEYEQAEAFLKDALSIRREVLGNEHPYTAQTINNLADLYCEQGLYVQAEEAAQEALRIRKQALSPQHMKIAQSFYTMATIARARGIYSQAEAFYKQALDIDQHIFGWDHPDVRKILDSYVSLLKQTDRIKEAQELIAQAQSIAPRRNEGGTE